VGRNRTREVAVRRFNSLNPLVFTAFLAAGPAAAQSASDLFAEGNALVRSGVYRTALLRYREAAAAGLDSPLLHFNQGVVYYRLGEFDMAAAEFGQAAIDPELSGLATYNRGLALRASGDRAGAEQSFNDVAENADERELRRLAEGATAGTTTTTLTPSVQGAGDEGESRGIGDFRLTAAARFGQDDNVYRTPAESYVDLSDPAQPLVTPVPQSGTYVPAELHAAYVLHNEAGDTDFLFAYDVAGAFYGEEVANATEVNQQFSMGADVLLGERERRRREVSTAFFVRSHSETNFDPDDGLEREITVVDINGVATTEDVSERFSYDASGVRGTFGHRLGPWRWGFDMNFERREYEPTTLVANYDHDYLFTAVDIDYDFSSVMTLRGGIRSYQRRYDTRPARDLTGALLTTNPAQEYVYNGVQLGMSRQMGRVVAIDVDYLHLIRSDEYLGYYDYTQDVLRLRATFRPNPRFDWSVAAVGRTYDYPNAFAFNVAAGGPRELDEVAAELHGNFHLKYGLTLSASLDTFDATSTDARAAYTRSRASLGVEWRR
jgi:tetratricopeptide (TPR) repeat protein